MVYIFYQKVLRWLNFLPHYYSLSLSLLVILEMKKLINWQKKLQNFRVNLILQPLQQVVKHMNTYLPNGNEYREIDLKIDNMALQTIFPYLFNPPSNLKSCTTKEKYFATLCNAEQITVTLETTINLQFLQKTYSALLEKKYKHGNTSLTYTPNMRTTTKFSTMSQAPYIC